MCARLLPSWSTAKSLGHYSNIYYLARRRIRGTSLAGKIVSARLPFLSSILCWVQDPFCLNAAFEEGVLTGIAWDHE
jgi:hypothetical protein